MRKELTNREWLDLNYEVGSLLDCLWKHAEQRAKGISNATAKAENMSDEDKSVLQENAFDMMRMDGWDRLVKIKWYIQKLGLPVGENGGITSPVDDEDITRMNQEIRMYNKIAILTIPVSPHSFDPVEIIEDKNSEH